MKVETENGTTNVENSPNGPNDRTFWSSLLGSRLGLLSVDTQNRRLLRAACESRAQVLLRGPTGSGKTTLARWIHDHSDRRSRPFVSINLATLHEETMESELFGHERGAFTGAQSARKGLLEMAHDGTLFLDEIGDLSLKYQARLLEFLHSGKIQRLGGLQVLRLNVRILAATHRNLEELVRVGKFREDLFHRLRVIQIELPSLQSCSEDFNDIFHEILTESSKKAGKRILKVSPDLARRLEAHCWNGNLRELRHVIEATVALSEGEELTLGDLPPWVEIAGADKSLNSNGSSTSSVALHAVMRTLLKTHPNYQEARLAFDRQLFEAALQKNYYRVTRTARFLGLPKTTLLRKLKKCGINTSMFLKSELNPDEPEHA